MDKELDMLYDKYIEDTWDERIDNYNNLAIMIDNFY